MPDTVAPSAGAVSETVGGVVSPAGVVTLTGSEGADTLPGRVEGLDRIGVAGARGDGRVGEARPGDFADLGCAAEDPVAGDAQVVGARFPASAGPARPSPNRRRDWRGLTGAGVSVDSGKDLDRRQVPAVGGRRRVVDRHLGPPERRRRALPLDPHRVADGGEELVDLGLPRSHRCAPSLCPNRCRPPRPRIPVGWSSATPMERPSRRRLPPVAPSASRSAPVSATTVIADCYDPLPRVAVTLTLLSVVAADACQISAVPAWAFARRRSRQVRLPPLTLEIV